MAIRLCKVCRDWHDLDKPWPVACIKIERELRGPWRVHVIGDVMSPVQGQHDGKMYDSKSKLRASYRAHGMIEVGNDPARFRNAPKPNIDRKAIRAALERAHSRVSLTS